VDDRRLYARFAVPSLFAYCREVLRFSEFEACARIAVARASRSHPMLLDMLEDGRIHLSGLAKLVPHLTVENRDALLRSATHRSKREIEELIAELSPRPDVPESVRRLEARTVPLSAVPAVVLPPSGECRSDAEAGLPCLGKVNAGRAVGACVQRDNISGLASAERTVEGAESRAAAIQPLGAGRYRIQLTASAALRDKLERLQGFMRSSRNDACLAAVIEAAVDEKLQRLDARRRGLSKVPRSTVAANDKLPHSRHLPAAVRRTVWKRDQGRCGFVDAEGRRCTAMHRLEFHHHHPYAMGGDHSVANVALRCRLHNAFLAEVDYGRRVRRSGHQPLTTAGGSG
jgi:hypothetical protein